MTRARSWDDAMPARSEKQIQAECVKVLKQLGFRVWNLSQARASRQSSGLGDIYVCGHGVCCWIEMKTPTGSQTVAQVEFQRAVDGNHGHYLLARSESDVIAWARPYVTRTGEALNRLPKGAM